MKDHIELIESVDAYCTRCRRCIEADGTWDSAYEAGEAHECGDEPAEGVAEVVAVVAALPPDHTAIVRLPAGMSRAEIDAISAHTTNAASGGSVLFIDADTTIVPMSIGDVLAMLDELLNGAPYHSSREWDDARHDFASAVLLWAAAGRGTP